jgi:glucose/arabinose dehydrogenase
MVSQMRRAGWTILLLGVLLAMPLPDAARAQPGLSPHRLRVPARAGPVDATILLPNGFSIGIFASGLGHARMLAESPSGELVLSEHWEGRVLKLADRDGDGVADEVVPILAGLDVPHGLAFAGEALFVAETHRVLRLDVWWDGGSAREIARLPGHGHHQTRSLTVGPDGRLYVSIGSSCDVCVEDEPMRAAVWRFNPDGGGGEPYAVGLRNAVGLAWEPGADRLWATENERNELGEEIPPDELDVLRQGGDYGWPSCYGDRIADPAFGGPERCARTEAPALELPAHSAPLGLAFYDRGGFPSEYRGDLFVALHGSAVRERPVGYSLVRVPIRDGRAQPAVEFARGWLVGDDSWGRPVSPFVARDGTLYLTDDKAGVVYRIRARSTEE